MKGKSKKPIIWNLEKCKIEALKYLYRVDFQKGSPAAYTRCWKQRWLDEVCKHMIKPDRKIIYTKEICRNKALEFDNRKDLIKTAERYYRVMMRNGWMNELCSHMDLKGNLNKRCIYAYEFPDNHVYVGLTFNINVRNSCHMKSGPVKNHITNTGLKPIFKQITYFLTLQDAVYFESYFQNLYISNGWIPLFKAKAGALGHVSIKWNKNRCHEEAMKYKCRSEFNKISPTAYNHALKNGWLNEICSHMIKPKDKLYTSVIIVKNDNEYHFTSVQEAAKFINVHPSNVSKVLTRNHKTVRGYTAKYA